MSMHRIPLTQIEQEGLRAHGLDIGTPSQLSDVFRQGVAWGLKADRPAQTMDRSERRVVCAAIRAADGEVLLGIRHYSEDMHYQIGIRRDGDDFKRRHDEDQGFIDQWGAFMSREEAYQAAPLLRYLHAPKRRTSGGISYTAVVIGAG